MLFKDMTENASLNKFYLKQELKKNGTYSKPSEICFRKENMIAYKPWITEDVINPKKE